MRFCDAFNIPIVTFVDVPGFLPGTARIWRVDQARRQAFVCLFAGDGTALRVPGARPGHLPQGGTGMDIWRSQREKDRLSGCGCNHLPCCSRCVRQFLG